MGLVTMLVGVVIAEVLRCCLSALIICKLTSNLGTMVVAILELLLADVIATVDEEGSAAATPPDDPPIPLPRVTVCAPAFLYGILLISLLLRPLIVDSQVPGVVLALSASLLLSSCMIFWLILLLLPLQLEFWAQTAGCYCDCIYCLTVARQDTTTLWWNGIKQLPGGVVEL